MITRHLKGISVIFDLNGEPIVQVAVEVFDSDKGTRSNAQRRLNQAGIVNIATNIRDAVVQLAADAGKPVIVEGMI